MALSKEDLTSIEQIVSVSLEKALEPIKKDLSEVKNDLTEVKNDVSLLAALNQLEEIRKDKRLHGLYSSPTRV